ncbi:hypothetical protein AAC387_Pa01g2213 [Persea americana]
MQESSQPVANHTAAALKISTSHHLFTAQRPEVRFSPRGPLPLLPAVTLPPHCSTPSGQVVFLPLLAVKTLQPTAKFSQRPAFLDFTILTAVATTYSTTAATCQALTSGHDFLMPAALHLGGQDLIQRS